MWRFNWIEEIEAMGIQPWSQPGNNQTWKGIPYTGVCVREDQEPFIVHAENGLSHDQIKPELEQKAVEKGGKLVAIVGGWVSEKSIIA